MFTSQTDEIKSKLSVEEVISGYLQLQRAGRNLKANCPFHNEKTPSFMVSPERQMWHCFGCGEGGDIFSFVMKIEGLEFRDALKLLAEKARVELKSTGYKSSDGGRKKRVLEVVEVSRKFYEECLKIKTGKKAFEYLSKRGLSKNTIEKFQLGYAPDSWDLLSKFLKKKGYRDSEIFAAGMTVRKDRGGYYDRFRGRIMFPINNVSGQTVGFSSRVMPGQDESQAKYINTPETVLYNKSQILYGLDRAKLAIRKNDLAILVEGNMDVIASFQAEIENVVAASGTALTAEQIRIIKRYTDNVAFSFDLDSAGIQAANRGIEIALAEGMSVQVATVPEGKDPADCVKSNPDLWKKAVKNPKPIMEFYFESVFAKYDLIKIEDKKKIATELLNIISKISNKIEQSHYLQILAEKLSVDEKVLREILENAEKNKPCFENKFKKNENDPQILDTANREKQLQEKLLGLVILNPQIFGEIYTNDLGELFLNQKLNTIYNLIKELYLENKKLKSEDLERLKSELSTEKYLADGQSELLYLWNTAALRIEAELEAISNIFEEASVCVLNLKKIKLHKDLKKLELDIKNAERANDSESQKLLMGEFDKCVKELGELKE
ncbi:MAG: DNA primase [Candidatus Pacebacteria bacterium]|nr:DNA primase [Candidatus Paceibacterota bacterium]